jgi:Cytochrome c554 and c-prime
MNTPQSRRQDRSPAVGTVTIVGFGLLLAAIALWVVLNPPRRNNPASRSGPSFAPRAAYVGSDVCISCHPGESAAHSRSGHARTLRRVANTPLAQKLDGLTAPDPEQPGVTWRFEARDGTLLIERNEKGEVSRQLIEYAFGSGHHATTFVTLTDRAPEQPAMIEHRMTVFAHKGVPDITPGQAVDGKQEGLERSGRRYTGANALKCFECHTTLLSDRGPRALDESTMIPNVGCERCHGPGKSHVEAARAGAADVKLTMPFGPGGSTTDEQMRMCGACHRLPSMGDASLIRVDNPVLVRFQPVGLMQSACYRESAGALSCVTCHDPHSRTSTNRAEYEAVCLSCHQGPSKTPCKVSPATACLGCHMPRRDVSRGMLLTDHWIRLPDASLRAPEGGLSSDEGPGPGNKGGRRYQAGPGPELRRSGQNSGDARE